MTPPNGNWTQIELAAHACRVFEPSRSCEHGYTVVYLHDVQGDNPAGRPWLARLLDAHGLRSIAPITGPSWWTDKICPPFDAHLTAERYVTEHVVPHVAEHWSARPPRLALFGVGMGGQGALRLAFRHPETFPVSAALTPAIDYHLLVEEGDETLSLMYPDAEAARQDTATLHVHPLNWPRNLWFACDPADYLEHTASERLRMKLSALGIPHECDLESSAGTSDRPYDELMADAAIDFIVERLERERLRVV